MAEGYFGLCKSHSSSAEAYVYLQTLRSIILELGFRFWKLYQEAKPWAGPVLVC